MDLILRAFREDPQPFQISVAGSLHRAREVVLEDPPDLIITDWNLPDGKGIDILTRVDGIVTIPLIVMTGCGDEHLAVEIMKSGAVDYIVKSATVFEDLPNIARRALRFWDNLHERRRAERAVQESQKRLADILSFMPDPVLAIDCNGTVIAWNNAMEGLTGVPAADMLGKGNYEYSLPFYGERRPILVDLVLSDDPEVRKTYQYTKNENRKIVAETYVPLMNGGRGIYLWGTASPLFDDDGNCSGAIEVIRDITERKQKEQEILFNNILLSTQQDASPDGILVVDKNAVILHCNRQFTEIWSVPDQILVSRNDEHLLLYVATQLVDPDVFLARIRYLYDHKDEKSFDELALKDGRIVERFSAPLLGDDGNYFGRTWYFRDITERKKAEQIIKASEEKFRTLIDNVPDFIIVHRDGILLFVSHAASEMTGYSPDELIGRKMLDFVSPEDQERIVSAMQRRMKNEPVEPYEITILTRSGGQRQVIVRGSSIEFDGGPASLNVLTDVTELRKGEKQLLLKNIVFEASVTANSITDNNGKITDINPAFLALWGYKEKEEVIGKPVGSFFADENKVQAVLKTLDSSGHWSGEFVARRADGSTFFVFGTATIIIDALGEKIGYQSTCLDISEQKRIEASLLESEAKFRDLFNNMSSGVVIYEPTSEGEDFIISNINHAVERIENVRKEDVVGKSVLEVFPGVVEFGLFAVFQRVGKTGTAEAFPVSFYKDNRISGWRDNYVYRLASGEIVSIYEDVTEKMQAEEAARESDERFRIVSRATNDTIWDWDLTTGHLWWSDGIYNVFGYHEGEIEFSIGTWETLVHPDDRERVVTGLNNTIDTWGEKWSDEYRLRRADGSYAAVLDRGFIIRDTGKKAVRMVGSILDLTERKASEQALANEATRRRILVDQSRDGIVTLDQEGKVFESNQRFADMLGYTPDEMKDLHVWDWEAVATKEQLEGMISSVDTMGDHFETRHRRKDGSLLDVEISTNAAEFAGQKLIFCVVRDISAKSAALRALEASEEKFRTVADYTYDWEYWLLPDGTYQYVSPSCERVTGYTPDDFYRDPDLLKKIIVPDDLPKIIAHTESGYIEDEAEGSIEFRVRAKSGNVIWVGHICRPLFNSAGTFIGRRGSNRDITKRRQAEMALRESEERFRAIIQNSSDIIRILDRNGRIIYESPSAGRILGYPPGSLVGSDPMDLIHPEDLDRVKNDLQDVVNRNNSGTPTEFRIRRADGEYLWVDSIAVNLLDVNGINGIVVTTRPIQQRKEAEAALSESRDRLSLALEGADAGFWDWHLPTGKAVFSDRYYTMLGYEPGEFPAQYDTWIALMHPDDRDRLLASLQQQIREKRPLIEIEYRIRAREGNWLWILGRGKVVEWNEPGDPIRMTGVNIDITNRRLMESEIPSLNTVLEQRVKDRTEALSKTNEALEEENAQRLEAEKQLRASVDEKTMLLKEIHHRVKNNLQIIASLLNLQSRYVKDESTLAAIRESQNRVKAMALVHEKLYRSEDLSRIDLHEYLKFLGTGLFQFYDARSRGIRFVLDMENVEADISTAIPLGLIINELISNSLKYAFPEGRGGEVAISIKREERTLTVRFHDNGTGIPASLDWKDTQSLGLRLVNTLVDQLNGTIELDRTSGTCFTMVLHERQ